MLNSATLQKYRIHQTLSRSSSSATYRAEDIDTGQVVALKVLSLRQAHDWKVIELFEREAQTLGQLNHPAIPRYLDYFHLDTESDRYFCLVRSWVEGNSLADLVEGDWHTKEAEVRQIAEQVLDILVYLQGLTPSIIHRDIKPQNLIRDTDGKVFLVDFGSVRQIYHNTLFQGSTVVGSYGYMAPEQFRGQAIPATDLYGLGATLLFVLSRRSPAELPTQGLKLDFRSDISDIGVSPSLADWLEHILEPEVEDRFPSASIALRALQGKWILPTKKQRAAWIQSWKAMVEIGITIIVVLTLLNHFKFPILESLGFTVALRKAVLEGKINVDEYLTFGGDPNDYVNEKTLLYRAVIKGDSELVKSLLEGGADLDIGTAEGRTPLHDARHKQIAEQLIVWGADVNAKDDHGDTPLHRSSWKKVEIAKLLLAHGADVNARNKSGLTPLHYSRNLELAELFLARGADVDARENDGNTPLHYSSSIELAELFLAHDADVNARNSNGETPLHRTHKKKKNSLELAELFLAHDANVNAKDNDGQTSLHQTKSPELGQLLLAHGANVNAKNNDDQTPLYRVHNQELAELFINNGALVNPRDNESRTPLHHETNTYNTYHVIAILLKNGAEVNLKDRQGKTPLHYAAKKGALRNVETLLFYGADVNAKDNDGRTPLDLARRWNVVEMLRRHGGACSKNCR